MFGKKKIFEKEDSQGARDIGSQRVVGKGERPKRREGVGAMTQKKRLTKIRLESLLRKTKMETAQERTGRSFERTYQKGMGGKVTSGFRDGGQRKMAAFQKEE